MSGGSDDIGDVSWKVPTVTLSFPSNIPKLQGHHWSNAIVMATPIAHKGATAGAKVVAMTVVDFFDAATAVAQAKDYFTNVQSKETTYKPMITADDPPPVELNTQIMTTFRPELEKFIDDGNPKYDSFGVVRALSYLKTQK